MEETDDRQHLKSMDVLKGIIMAVIVIGHMFLVDGAGGDPSGQDVRQLPPILQALYLGLMAYLILSGYFYRPRGFKNNMLKRLKQLGLVTAVASLILPLILWLYLNAFGYDLPISDYFDAVLRNVGLYNLAGDLPATPCYTFINFGSYFLIGMLWGFLIFYALADRILDDWRKVFATILILLVIEVIVVEFIPFKLPLLMKLGPINAAFMFFGGWLARRRFLENIEYGNKREPKYWAIPIVCFIAGVALCILLPPGIGYDVLYFGDYGAISVFPYFLEAILMFVPIALLGFIFSKIPVFSTLLDFLGRHTVGIILLHPVVGKMLAVAMGITLSGGVDILPADVSTEVRVFIGLVALFLPAVILHFCPMLIDRMKKPKEADKAEPSS
jgi:fucose 4-O-acetylase-like acetyltransferase